MPIRAVASELGEAVTQKDLEAFVDYDNVVACSGTLIDAEICRPVQREAEHGNDDNGIEELEEMQLHFLLLRSSCSFL